MSEADGTQPTYHRVPTRDARSVTGGTQTGANQIAATVPIDDGLFNALVDTCDEFGAQAFNGEARWLQIEVCTDGTCASTTVLVLR
ncbi:MAG: hypothetical protein HOP12_01575 [Candidatus Eisenbacteria bacterium]|uniref:Uncharacterized protein n=1 Tax=Eiseniibacteriota bacterium TaxID=2212470 RepID=A0A849SAZ2_UNCEI|nr:hypothetical protein [Candidatus Eisenbacteria bacterium]